jgi:5'-nucleotidase
MSLMVVAMMMVVGCQDRPQPAPSSSALDVSPAQNPSVAPVAYAAPIQSATPDASLSASTPAMSAAAAAGGTYTVKPGDTLWKIAATHYGDGRKWKQIADANNGLDPSKLRVGQTITLP